MHTSPASFFPLQPLQVVYIVNILCTQGRRLTAGRRGASAVGGPLGGGGPGGSRRSHRFHDKSTGLDGRYVSTVSETGPDTVCIHCIWNLLAQKQPVLYLLYLEQSWIQSRYSVSVDPYLCISHLGSGTSSDMYHSLCPQMVPCGFTCFIRFIVHRLFELTFPPVAEG